MPARAWRRSRANGGLAQYRMSRSRPPRSSPWICTEASTLNPAATDGVRRPELPSAGSAKLTRRIPARPAFGGCPAGRDPPAPQALQAGPGVAGRYPRSRCVTVFTDRSTKVSLQSKAPKSRDSRWLNFLDRVSATPRVDPSEPGGHPSYDTRTPRRGLPRETGACAHNRR